MKKEAIREILIPYKNVTELYAPSDVKINGLRFVGYPIQLKVKENDSLKIDSLNITFVVRATCSSGWFTNWSFVNVALWLSEKAISINLKTLFKRSSKDIMISLEKYQRRLS